jgi:uncharacterized protein (TIGR03086 family)
MDGGWRSSVTGRFAELLDRLGTAERYRRLASGFLERIAGTAPAAWDAPSPCAGWTARDVVAHVVNGHRGILAAVLGERPVPAFGVGVGPMDGAPPVEPGADLAAAFTDCRDRVLAVLADPELAATPLKFSPLGPVPVVVAADRIGALELLVHTWDLARASGGDERLDAELAARTHEALLPHRDALLATGAFRSGVEPPPGADPQAALLTFAGRSLAPPAAAG